MSGHMFFFNKKIVCSSSVSAFMANMSNSIMKSAMFFFPYLKNSIFHSASAAFVLSLDKLVYNLLKNFCPIILLNILRKLIEKVIIKRSQIYSLTSNFVYLNKLKGLKQCSILDTSLYLIYLIYAR